MQNWHRIDKCLRAVPKGVQTVACHRDKSWSLAAKIVDIRNPAHMPHKLFERTQNMRRRSFLQESWLCRRHKHMVVPTTLLQGHPSKRTRRMSFVARDVLLHPCHRFGMEPRTANIHISPGKRGAKPRADQDLQSRPRLASFRSFPTEPRSSLLDKSFASS